MPIVHLHAQRDSKTYFIVLNNNPRQYILMVSKTKIKFFDDKVNVISNLITVQKDATYSVYYISVGSSTCFGC